MPTFSKRSLENLSQCHPDLQAIAHEAIKEIDFSVICGHRGEAEQNIAFLEGKSKVMWPDSEHNRIPSHAMDIVPYPCDWSDIDGFIKLGEVIIKVADRLGIKIRWGRYFDFKDYPHFELVSVSNLT